MRNIVKNLRVGEEDMDLLAIEMSSLQKTAKICATESHEIYKAYDSWAWCVQELYEAALGSQADTAVRLGTVSSDKAAAEALKKEREENVNNAKTLMTKMEKELSDASTAYKKALDTMPTG